MCTCSLQAGGANVSMASLRMAGVLLAGMERTEEGKDSHPVRKRKMKRSVCVGGQWNMTFQTPSGQEVP